MRFASVHGYHISRIVRELPVLLVLLNGLMQGRKSRVDLGGLGRVILVPCLLILLLASEQALDGLANRLYERYGLPDHPIHRLIHRRLRLIDGVAHWL